MLITKIRDVDPHLVIVSVDQLDRDANVIQFHLLLS
jgi:hypothetical protein